MCAIFAARLGRSSTASPSALISAPMMRRCKRRAPVMSLLEAALPQRQIGLIGFNDRRCRSPAELRSVILKARAVALENAEHHRAAEAFKQRLLAELNRDPAVRRAAGCRAPAEMSMPAQRLAAQTYPIPPSLIRQASGEPFRRVALPEPIATD
jgi:hypothetical protein